MFTTSSLIFGTLLIVKWRCQVIIPTERLTGTARRRWVSPDTSDSKTSRQEGRGDGGTALPTYKQTRVWIRDLVLGYNACATHKLVVSKQCARRHAANLYYLGLGGNITANHFTPMRQLELGSDKELAHMCAWYSSMILTNLNQKFANSRGVELESGKEPCEAGKWQRTVRSGKAAKSRAKRESGKEPCEAGKRQRTVRSGEGNAPHIQTNLSKKMQ